MIDLADLDFPGRVALASLPTCPSRDLRHLGIRVHHPFCFWYPTLRLWLKEDQEHGSVDTLISFDRRSLIEWTNALSAEAKPLPLDSSAEKVASRIQQVLERRPPAFKATSSSEDEAFDAEDFDTDLSLCPLLEKTASAPMQSKSPLPSAKDIQSVQCCLNREGGTSHVLEQWIELKPGIPHFTQDEAGWLDAALPYLKRLHSDPSQAGLRFRIYEAGTVPKELVEEWGYKILSLEVS
jgi:hypothetical protein